ncbi:MAG: phytanoyl-CoA dioxygenase family protein [Gammaproteobacteria bacterium]|nr:phytanoyl-CoA dioxygenase family protein [Gammaproteobacteria bacterium]
MRELSYGAVEQTRVDSDIGRHVEEIRLTGYTIVPSLVDGADLVEWRDRIDMTYRRQEDEFGADALRSIDELDLCRAPLLYDRDFIQLASHPYVMAVVRCLLGDWFILNLQNAIINRPGTFHHQGSWHRDLPYQNFVISRPLAINALFAIDEFSAETGATMLMPFSHRMEVLPSDDYMERHRVGACAPAGSVVIFDSMLFHRAGSNSSSGVRRAVNHLYTVPIIKQQYDIPAALGESYAADPDLARLLGYTARVPRDDRSWRRARAAKLGVEV